MSQSTSSRSSTPSREPTPVVQKQIESPRQLLYKKALRILPYVAGGVAVPVGAYMLNRFHKMQLLANTPRQINITSSLAY